MAAIVNTRELMLQTTDASVTLRSPKTIYSITQPWTNLLTQPGITEVTNLTNPSVEITNPFGVLSTVNDFIKFVPTATNAEHKINEQNILSVSVPFVSGQKVEQTVYVKDVVVGTAGSNHKLICKLNANGPGNTHVLQYTFDPSLGKFIASSIGTGWTNCSGTYTPLNNSWWKVTITGTFTTVGIETTTGIFSNWLLTNSTQQTTFSGGAGLYLYGFQTYYAATLPDEVINDSWYNSKTSITKVWNGYDFILVSSSPTTFYLNFNSPVIKKSAASAIADGDYTEIIVTGKKTVGTVTTTSGYVTVTSDVDTATATTAVATPFTITTALDSKVSSYTVNLYDAADTTASSTTLLDTEIIPVVFDGSNALTISLTNDNCTIPASATGAATTYANTGTKISVYEGANLLTYSPGSTAAGTYSIATAPVGITPGAITGTATTTASVAIASAMADATTTATITFTITGKTKNNVSFTRLAIQTFTKGKDGATGADSTIYYITTTASTLKKSAASATATGAYTTATVSGAKSVGSVVTTPVGYLTVTANTPGTAGTEASTATLVPAIGIPIAPTNISGVSSYTIKMYDGPTTATAQLLDTEIIPVLFDGSNAVTVNLTNDNCTIPAGPTGTATTYANTGTNIVVYEGATALQYTAAGTAAGTYNITASPSGITAGAIAAPGTATTTASVATASAMADATTTATITFTITGKTLNNTSFTLTAVQTFTKNKDGAAGADGNNALTISLTNGNCNVPGSAAGVYNYSNTGTNIVVREGATALQYTAAGTAAGTYNITASPSGITAGAIAAPGTATTTASVATASAMTADAATITYTINGKTLNNTSFTLTSTQTITRTRDGDPGAEGTKSATVYLYKWSSTTPTVPTGTNSSYDWTTKTHSGWIDNTNGWYLTAPDQTVTNKLWIASLDISAVVSANSTTIYGSGTNTPNWASSVVSLVNQAGAFGTKTANAVVYAWGSTVPTLGGTSTYTWATGTLNAAPSGWTLAAGTSPTPGYNLYAATAELVANRSATTSTVTWSLAVPGIVGYASPGTQGASIRTAYSRIANNPTPISTTIQTTGSVSFPSSAESGTAWGSPAFTVSWSGTDPAPTSTNSLYQSDGIYNPATNLTTWAAPYISSLKVGNLAAVSVNTGILNVDNVITVGSGANAGSIKGGQTDYSTGTGFFLGYSGSAYKFSIGNPAGNQLTWDGATLSMPAATITGTLTANQIAAGAITTDKLLVTSKGNALNDDPGIQDINAWELIGAGTTRVTGALATGAAGSNYFTNSTGGGNARVWSRSIEIDPAKTYLLTANLYAATGNNRNMYIFVNMYDINGTQVATSPNWGGTLSGYVYGATPAVGVWTRYGGQFGAGNTAAPIPSNVVTVRIGVWFQYSSAGTSSVQQAAQDIRLERVNDGTLVVDGSITATKINSNGLSIKDAAGNVILSAGASVAASTFGGAVSSTATIGGTTASTVVSNASNALTTATAAASTASSALTTANAASTAAASKLSATAQNVLSGSGGLATGNLTWNTSGTYTGGSGIGITAKGIVAYNNAPTPTATFVLDGTTGSATFAGSLNAATGTFSGSLNVASAASGERLVITSTQILVYDASGLRVKIGNLA